MENPDVNFMFVKKKPSPTEPPVEEPTKDPDLKDKK